MIRKQSCLWPAVVGAVGVALMASVQAHASLSRNAAGAKNIGEAGGLTVDTAGQLESEPGGKVWLLETVIQYQVSNRLQFLVEAILHESQQPDAGESVSGIGDTDLTLSWLASGGSRLLPSVVLGTQVKLPTASRRRMGQARWTT